MSKEMLIDATQPEESRVAIVNNGQLEVLDFETSTKKQLKGNIYLAKVIRIEPSLQAAFVEFGGNRHGFLAFNEIHPDYYRIPVEDREELLAQQAELEQEIEDVAETQAQSGVEVLGGEDVEEIQARPRRTPSMRQYKIQEVVKRNQIMLVQVVKEERGGKGAALTTYLSLAGRYCVLMPNAAKGGGISRKITSASDRKRLREIIEDLALPKGMSLIIRTAGMARTKVEIKKDCDYLTKLWNDIRETTLHSIAPCLIYEESNLIKRAIRDYYARDVDEVWVEGEESYKEAKKFIQKLMPSHAKKIKQYKEEKIPLFYRYGIEQQIDAIHNPVVQLKSGGYIVFGTTEALVAIDVNSGKATRERHIEETAFKTNLEAAEEVARQLRLRDLAGLVVVDFIDMDETRNIEAVERRLKDAMQTDRARVQVGRISPFGLLELSRQRLRPNIIESTSLPCKVCKGSGMIRSVESSSLHVLRGIEEEAFAQKASEITVHVPAEIALYILNQKRSAVQALEDRWEISIQFVEDEDLIQPDFRLERTRLRRGEEKGVSQAQERKEAGAQVKREGRQPSRQKGRMPQQQRERGEKEKVAASQEAAPTQEQQKSPQKQSSRSRSRRRYRKFDRRPFPEGTSEGKSQTQPAVEQAPQPAQETKAASPKEAKPKPRRKAQAASEKKEPEKPVPSAPLEQKKTGTRKGWWQRLME